MGYTITIGELEVTKSPEDGLDSDCIGFSAYSARHDNAPAFGEPTDYTNSRWPSYGVWSNALARFGLKEVFFYEGHLIGGHPGVRLVTAELVGAVSSALAAYRVRFPNAEPKMEVDDESADLARIVWLDYWLTWALANCETPVIANI